MISQSKNGLVLPADRAFVVQLSRDDGNDSSRYAGRIEHIESGRVEFFDSSEEMCTRLRAILDQVQIDSET